MMTYFNCIQKANERILFYFSVKLNDPFGHIGVHAQADLIYALLQTVERATDRIELVRTCVQCGQMLLNACIRMHQIVDL